jgi:thiol-disulfide isomerase/thioredoxin
MKRRLFLSLAFLACAAATGWLFRNALRPSGQGGSLKSLRGRPGLVVQPKEGRGVDLSQEQGRVIVVHFWATWCAPCLEELPALEQFWRRFEGRSDIALFAVATDKEGWEKIGPWVAERKVGLPVFVDPGGKVAERFGTTMFPETYVVDREGKVVQRIENAVDWTKPEVAAFFDNLLAAKEEK